MLIFVEVRYNQGLVFEGEAAARFLAALETAIVVEKEGGFGKEEKFSVKDHADLILQAIDPKQIIREEEKLIVDPVSDIPVAYGGSASGVQGQPLFIDVRVKDPESTDANA